MAFARRMGGTIGGGRVAAARPRDESFDTVGDDRAVAECRQQPSQNTGLDAGDRGKTRVRRERAIPREPPRRGGEPLQPIRPQRQPVGDKKAERRIKRGR